MKIGIIGDTHGSRRSLEIIEKNFSKVNFFVHTGDHWTDGQLLEKKLRVPVLAVKGNCDSGDFSSELRFAVKGYRFFVTHGHQYQVKFGLQRLYYRSKEEQTDYCIYGHTHVPHCERIDGILFLNPGSLTWPRNAEQYAGILLEYSEAGFQARFVEADC